MRTFKIRGRLKEGQARGIQKRRARKTLGIRNYAETIRFYSYLPTDPEVVLLVMLPWVGCDADERGGFESAPASVLLVQPIGWQSSQSVQTSIKGRDQS
jgi:hypothetical protein